MLTPDEQTEWARRLGVAEDQVRLDHLLFHLLLGLASIAGEHIIFLGGTALCRTHLATPPWTRVSEDLDLLVAGPPTTVEVVERQLPRTLRREYPGAAWLVAPTAVRPPAAATLASGRSTVRVQLLPAAGAWAAWREVPLERRPVDLRYDDTPGTVVLVVPTLAGFAAMKLSAWEDRAAPRDLFDLAGLVTLAAFGPPTAAAFTRLTGRLPDQRSYEVVPETVRTRWADQLGHQATILPDPAACLRSVAVAVNDMLGDR